MCVFVLHVLDYIFSITCSHGESYKVIIILFNCQDDMHIVFFF